MKKKRTMLRFSRGSMAKILLKMKLLIILICSVFTVSAINSYSQTAKFNLDLKNATVNEVFLQIEENSDFILLYNEKQVDVDRKVNVFAENEGVEFILDQVFKNTQNTYKINDRQIVILEKDGQSSPRGVRSKNNVLQKQQVTGTVKDESGLPLPGVSVVIKGTTMGTITSFEGKFTIEVPGTANFLQFSFVGMETQEVEYTGQTSIDIVMKEESLGIDEVVVVGYGTMKKSDVTGAVESISGSVLNETKTSNPLASLAGKVAGVDISFDTNDPGGTPDILIRGRSSLNFSNQPLFVIDGIPVSGGLDDFNPNDIQSMEVLKDASSAAIYGARGANGVVLITTKRGKAGATKVTYESYVGFSQPYEKMAFQDTEAYVRGKIEQERIRMEQTGPRDEWKTPGTIPISAVDINKALNENPALIEAYNAGVDTDFQEYMYQNGLQQSHQIGVSGGNESITYNNTLNYFKQDGILKGSKYDRYTFRTNIDLKITPKLSAGISQQISYSITDRKASFSTVRNLKNAVPLTRAFKADGITPTYDPLNDGLFVNPINDIFKDQVLDERRSLRYFANIFAQYKITDDLTYRLNVGPELQFIGDNDYRQENATEAMENPGGYARKEVRFRTSYTIENLLLYRKEFNKNHTLDATLLFSIQDSRNERTRVGTENFPSDTQTYNSLQSGLSDRIIRESSLDEESWVSYMARANYSFKDKYVFTLTARYDGSSKLSKGNKYGFFPSGAFAWKAIKEDLFASQDVLSDLKFRLGYGTVGRNPIPPYATLGGLRETEGSFGNKPALGMIPEDIANPDLKWEITTTLDAGVEFGFLNNRILGSIDVYRGETSDLLLNRKLPSTSGFDQILMNIGETKNSGIEVVLGGTIINSRGFKWDLDVNYAVNKNEIVKLSEEGDDVGNSWFLGEPIAVLFDRENGGVWRLNEIEEAREYAAWPGDYKEVDQLTVDTDNDGVPDAKDGVLNDADRVIVGQLDPKWTGGLTSKMSYKGFDLTVVAYTRQGHVVRHDLTIGNGTRFNGSDVDYWTPENDGAEFPRVAYWKPSGNIVDASFTKIRNITLGYNLKDSDANKLGLSRCRLYVNVQNPFMFRAWDVPGFDSDVADNVGGNYLPPQKTFLLGLNVTF